MHNLISIFLGAIGVILPNFIFKSMLFNSRLASPEHFIKRLYYAQVVKILLVIAMLSMFYLIPANVKMVVISFVVTNMLAVASNFIRYDIR
jgi:hypothetical protein